MCRKYRLRKYHLSMVNKHVRYGFLLSLKIIIIIYAFGVYLSIRVIIISKSAITVQPV